MTIQETAFYRITLFLSLMTISIIQVDRPLAVFIHNNLSSLQAPFGKILSAIEFLAAFAISKYLIGIIIFSSGLLLWAKDRSIAQRANIFLFIGATQIASRLSAVVLENIFDRSRPYVFVQDQSVSDFFCVGGGAFPSMHAAHFFGLFLPLTVLFPRYKWGLLIIPVFVALQRVIANEHYISDVLGGILIAALFTVMFQGAFKVAPLQNRPVKS